MFFVVSGCVVAMVTIYHSLYLLKTFVSKELCSCARDHAPVSANRVSVATLLLTWLSIDSQQILGSSSSTTMIRLDCYFQSIVTLICGKCRYSLYPREMMLAAPTSSGFSLLDAFNEARISPLVWLQHRCVVILLRRTSCSLVSSVSLFMTLLALSR